MRFLQLDKLPIDRRGVTDFTYSRFLVPWLCGFEGRAVFGDGCDQLCLGDVAELAAWDMQGKPLWVVKHPSPRHVPRHDRARSWTSLMLMDCAKLTGWGVDYVARQPDDQLMRLRILADAEIGELPPAWNHIPQPDKIDVTMPRTGVSQFADGLIDPEPPEWVKVMHWSQLSDPNGGGWIDRSRSTVWAEWRERWRAARGGRAA